jgi:hypothetical protein
MVWSTGKPEQWHLIWVAQTIERERELVGHTQATEHELN